MMDYAEKCRINKINGALSVSKHRAMNLLSGDLLKKAYIVIVNYSGSIYRKFFTQSCDQFCPECGDIFIPNSLTQIYCNKKGSMNRSLCGNVVGERKRYLKEREDSKYDKRRMMRNKSIKEWRLRKKNEGLCSRCGKRKPHTGYKVCEICRNKIELHRNR